MAAHRPANLKLYYFDFPGKAETTRIMLRWADIPFEDITFNKEEWPNYKTGMPYGQVPVLIIDGKKLAQQRAIEHYVAGLAGLIPDDPFKAAKVDEVVAYLVEMFELFGPTHRIEDAEARKKARQDIVAGPLKAKLDRLSEMVGPAGDYFLGSITYADFAAFTATSMLTSGFADGVPTTLLNEYPALKAHHNRIAALPAVAKMYETATEGYRLAFKVQP